MVNLSIALPWQEVSSGPSVELLSVMISTEKWKKFRYMMW